MTKPTYTSTGRSKDVPPPEADNQPYTIQHIELQMLFLNSAQAIALIILLSEKQSCSTWSLFWHHYKMTNVFILGFALSVITLENFHFKPHKCNTVMLGAYY